MTDFKYRGFFIVSSNDRGAINSAIKGDLDTEGGESTFTNWASTTGNSPPSHYYACSALTEEAVQQIKNISVSFQKYLSTGRKGNRKNYTGESGRVRNMFLQTIFSF